jgi:heptosyltransferase III
MSVEKKGILVTRTDKIGDLILSLPVIKTIKKVYPDIPIHMMVSSYAYPVVENYPGLSSIIRYDASDENNKVTRTKQLVQHLIDLDIEKALMLFYDPEVLSIIKKAGIKQRFGPLTKIAGMFSYTSWRSQHRSKVAQHELEYNLSLLEMLNINENDFETKLELPVSAAAINAAYAVLNKEGFENPSNGYIIIHPVCGGSALNWKYAYYAELANRLYSSTRLPIILTGLEHDSSVTNAIHQHINGNCFNMAGKLSLKELIAVISTAKMFIGPSTGPMHVAAATSVPLVAIFSPVKVQSIKRWGPYNKDAVAVSPKVDCPAKFKCLGPRCDYYNCMDSITPEEIFNKAKKLYDDTINQMGVFF